MVNPMLAEVRNRQSIHSGFVKSLLLTSPPGHPPLSLSQEQYLNAQEVNNGYFQLLGNFGYAVVLNGREG